MTTCCECVKCPGCGDVLYCLSEPTTSLPPCDHHGYCEMCRRDLCGVCATELQEVCS